MFCAVIYLHKLQAFISWERPSVDKANGYSLQKTQALSLPPSKPLPSKIREGKRGYK